MYTASGWIVAQPTGGGFDPSNPYTWIGGGAIGVSIAFVLFMFKNGWFVPGFIYQREVKRGDDYEASFKNEVIPAINASTKVLEQVLDLLKEFKADRDARLNQLMSQLEATGREKPQPVKRRSSRTTSSR